jgi:hypothetical protein
MKRVPYANFIVFASLTFLIQLLFSFESISASSLDFRLSGTLNQALFEMDRALNPAAYSCQNESITPTQITQRSEDEDYGPGKPRDQVASVSVRGNTLYYNGIISRVLSGGIAVTRCERPVDRVPSTS